MKNYKEMSDFEINRIVAIKLGHKSYHEDGSYTNDGRNVTVKGNGIIGWFNPCNNPSDAWPIIVKNKISLITDETTNEWTTGRIIDFTDETAYKYNTQDLKPLRSAMITFLMMKEKEQETK